MTTRENWEKSSNNLKKSFVVGLNAVNVDIWKDLCIIKNDQDKILYEIRVLDVY